MITAVQPWPSDRTEEPKVDDAAEEKVRAKVRVKKEREKEVIVNGMRSSKQTLTETEHC